MKRIPSIFLLFMAFSFPLNAQIILQGTVKDVTNNEPLVGAFITVKGMSGAIGVAELDGTYRLLVPTPSESRNIIVSVSHLGFVEKKDVVELLPIDDGETVILNFDLEPDPLSLKEIRVTANKVEEELQDVPIAISVLDAANLEVRSVSTAEQAFEVVPNMIFDGWLPGRPAIALRGMWTASVNPGLENSVGLYIDDVFHSRAFGYNSTLMDVERVEVLRGPQGTLFGKNTIGGLLNIITEKPKFGNSAAVELSGGNFNYLQARAKGNLEVVEDKLAIRATGAFRKRDNLIQIDDPEVADEQGTLNYGGRFSLRYKPNDRIDWILRANYNRTDRGDMTNEYRTPFHGIDLLPIRPEETDPKDRRSFINETESGYDARNYQFSSHIDYKLGNVHTLTAITSYFDTESLLDWDLDNSSANGTFYRRSDEVSTFTQEIRIATPRENRKFFYVAGLYYLADQVINNDSLAAKGGIADAWKFALQNPDLPINEENYFEYVNVDGTVDGSSFAAYVSSSLEISERIRLNGGLRYTIEDRSVEYSQIPFSPFGLMAGLVAAPIGVDEPIKREVTDRVFSGNFGIDLKTTDNTLLYVNYSRGFKGSGFNLTFNPDPDPEKAAFLFKPEFVNSYEVGIKMSTSNRIKLNAAAFVTDFKNKQEAVAAGTAIFVRNAKAIQGQGLEGEMIAIWNRFLKTDISLGFLNLRYLDFPFVDPVTLEQTNLSGNRAPRAPSLTFGISPEVHFPIGTDLKALVRVGYDYTSKAYNDIFNLDNIAREAAGILQARFTIATANQRLKLSLWGRNLTDVAVFTNGNSFFYGDYVSLNPARTLGVELRLNFYK